MDPFNFGELRKHAPRYLSLESLKDALQSSDLVNTSNEDVSMPDQNFSDDEVTKDPTPPPASPIEPELPKNSADLHPTPSLTVPRAPIISKGCDIYQPSTEYPPTCLNTVYTPTQAGAQLALPVSSGFFRMPLPFPWQANFWYIFSTYLQLGFNFGVLLVAIYLLRMVKRDVAKKIADQQAILVRHAAWCRHQFIANRCDANKVVPHLVKNKECLNLEHCMNADPDNIRWLSSYAALLAEIMNEFVNPLQMRTVWTLGGLLASLMMCVLANYWFGFWRAKSYFSGRNSQPDAKELVISKD